ncbi:rCG23685 [Rattus norvegicus]|uniref:RCG23685 n=1 Tax=Rattus norvegicus TaxID=10116 RepID=A6KJP1_RAT|nr:rCG23685 [Rattus norvegicus]
MLHLHEEEFQVLAEHVLVGREEVKPVIWSQWWWRRELQALSRERAMLTPASLQMSFRSVDMSQLHCFSRPVPQVTCSTHRLISLMT